jgi:hypothetical protein
LTEIVTKAVDDWLQTEGEVMTEELVEKLASESRPGQA